MTQDSGATEQRQGVVTVALGGSARRQLVKALAILVPLLVLAGAGAVLMAPHFLPGSIVIGLVAAGLLAALVVMMRLAPRMLTRQGIRLDDTALTLYAEPRWWFRGWRAVLPLTTIAAIAPTPPVGSSAPATASPGAGAEGTGALALTIDEAAPSGALPVWCTAVAPGEAPPNGEPADAAHRLHLELPAAEADRLRHAIEERLTVRPRTQPEGPDPIRDAWVSLRIGTVVRWGLASLTALTITQVPLWSSVSAGVFADQPDPILVGMIILSVLALVVIIRFAPSALARQGVAVGPDGIEVRRERLGWQAGCRWRLGWSELRALSGVFPDPGPLSELGDESERTPGPGTVLELILNGIPEQPPLPRWARVVPPGVQARRLVADRARLMIMAGESRSAARLSYLLGRRLGPVEDDEPDDAVRMVRWIPMPRRGVLRMIIAAGLLIFVEAGWLAWGLRPFANAPAWQEAIWPAVPLLAAAGIAWIVWWLLPARLARSGVQVESAGLQLVRERFLWSAEARSRLPWEWIGEIEVVRVFSAAALRHGLPVEQAVELELIMPAGSSSTRLPHWAVSRRTDSGRRVRVLTGELAAAELIRAIEELRTES
jgi:hypothetical protein